jgi:hypothetical protein
VKKVGDAKNQKDDETDF